MLLITAVLAAECPEPVGLAEITDEIDTAEQAYIALDELGFRDRVNQLFGILLPCLDEPLPPDLAARQHRLMAMQWSIVGASDDASTAMAASRRVDPEVSLPQTLIPTEHPLRTAYDAPSTTRTRSVSPPRSGAMAFDGVVTNRRPLRHPTVMQLFDGKGRATDTAYLAPGDPLPPYRAVPRQRRTLAAVAGGSAVAALSTYLMALGSKRTLVSSVSDPDSTQATLRRKRDIANGLTLTSGVFVGIGISSTAAAIAVGPR